MRNYIIDLTGMTEEQRIKLIGFLKRKDEVIFAESFIYNKQNLNNCYRYFTYSSSYRNWAGEHTIGPGKAIIGITEFLNKFAPTLKFKEL